MYTGKYWGSNHLSIYTEQSYPRAYCSHLIALHARFHSYRLGPPIVRGLSEALQTAKDRGVRCIAVTNAPRGAAEACLDSIRDNIPAASSILHETIVIGAECSRPKPDPEPYLRAARILGVDPMDCIVFEDSSSGVRAGAAAGVHAVVGLRTHMGDDALRAAGASMTIDDWRDLNTDLFEKLVMAMKGQSFSMPARRGALLSSLSESAASLTLASSNIVLLMAGLSLSALPGSCVQHTLHCSGDVGYPATAARASGAALFALAGAGHALGSRPLQESDPQHAGLEAESAAHTIPAQTALACGVLASTALTINTLNEDGHSLRPWARRLLFGSASLNAAMGMVSAALCYRPTRQTSRG